MGRWSFRIYVALQAAAIGVFACLPEEGWLHTIWQVAVGIAASAVIVVSAARRQPAGAGVWYWFAAGIFFNTTGILVAQLEPDKATELYAPTLADPFWLALLPSLMLGMAKLIRARDRTARWSDLVDTSTITTGFGLLSWVFLIRPQVLAAHVTFIGRALSLAYPVGDIVVLAMVVRLMQGPGLRGPSFRLLIASVLSFLTADVGWAVTANWPGADETVLPRIFSSLSLCAFAILGAAAVHPAMVQMALPKEVPKRARVHPLLMAALTVASLMTPSLLLAEALHGMVSDGLALGISATVLFLLMATRLSMLLSKVDVQGAHLAELSQVDDLTGLPNHRALAIELEHSFARAARESHPLSLAVLDLDGFQSFNNFHGHRAGDELLREVSRVWLAHLRAVDHLARFANDQFVALFPDASSAEALVVLERLRAAMPQGQTFSAGVALWNQIETADQLLARAASGLHIAKESGRDRRLIAEDERPSVTVFQGG